MSKQHLTRRQFLTLSSMLGSAALLQACQLGNTPTPTAQFGFSASTATGTASPVPQPITLTPTPGATIDPTATATATPEPMQEAGQTSPVDTVVDAGQTSPIQPIHTPTPTPYPPGPPSKLGLFLTRYAPQALQIIEAGKPPLIKTLELDPNFVAGIKASAPNSILVGRLVIDQMDLNADPIPLARSFVEKLVPIATEPQRFAAFTAWEAYNEPLVDSPDKMKRLADFEAERTRLLADYGIRSVVGNFATGHPDLPLWPEFVPALDAIREHNGFLGLHEYSAPIMEYRFGALQPEGDPDQGDEGWLTLRYRKAYRQFLGPLGYGNTPLLITECGVDGLVNNRPGPPDALGWQDFVETWQAGGLRDDPEGVYMDQLIWYDSELRRDDFVKGAAIFVAGASPGWETYEILGRTGDLLQQYLKAHPQPR